MPPFDTTLLVATVGGLLLLLVPGVRRRPGFRLWDGMFLIFIGLIWLMTSLLALRFGSPDPSLLADAVIGVGSLAIGLWSVNGAR